jgi:hypothetical protein
MIVSLPEIPNPVPSGARTDLDPVAVYSAIVVFTPAARPNTPPTPPPRLA